MENKTDTDNLLKTLEIYETSWQHRDNIMWKVNSMFFYAALICNLVPFISNQFDFSTFNVPSILFPIFGFILSIVFFFVALSYAARLEATGQTVTKINSLLPEKYKRIKIENTSIGQLKFTKWRMETWIPICTYFAILFISLLSFNTILYFMCKDGKTHISAIFIILSAIFILITIIAMVRILKITKKKGT